MEYEYQAYPKALYHASGASVTVANEDEHAALGDGYYESPADAQAESDGESEESEAGDPAGGAPAAKPRRGRPRKAQPDAPKGAE